VIPEPGPATPSHLQAHGTTTTTTAGAVRGRRWNRRERERAAKRLMSQAFMEIRVLACTAKDKEDPADALERIRLLADACHNLPGVIGRRPPRPGDADPFIGPWRHPHEQNWMARVLKSTDLETAWLDAASRWPPVLAPMERPRLARCGIRLPRSLHEYTSVDTTRLRSLVNEALEGGSPLEARQSYLRLLLAHVSPEGRHLIRAIRPGERPASASSGLTEFRCLVRMNDRAIIAFRPQLRSEALTAIPRRLSPVRQLWLAASTPRKPQFCNRLADAVALPVPPGKPATVSPDGWHADGSHPSLDGPTVGCHVRPGEPFPGYAMVLNTKGEVAISAHLRDKYGDLFARSDQTSRTVKFREK
jgi:hypothetical protein